MNILAVGCIVSNNHINTEASGIVVEYSEKCIIQGNIIRKDENTGVDPKYGLFVTYSMLDCTIGKNIFDCGASGANGIYIWTATTVVSRCIFEGNVVTRAAANVLNGIEFCTIVNNIFNSPISFGISTVKYGNKITGNHFKLSNAYGIAVDNQKGIIITTNTFEGANFAVLVQNSSSSGIIKNNISKGQSGELLLVI